LLLPLRESGILYADARANAVFLLGDTAATAVGAELRGTTARSWRGMAPGSRKDLGFFSIGPPAPKPSSCASRPSTPSVAMRFIQTTAACPPPGPDRTRHGCTNLIAQGLPIYCGFDADPTGDAMAQRMIQLHPSIADCARPAKDWNDALRSGSL
jgi:hypothetical protein